VRVETIAVVTTTAEKADADQLAQAVLERRLAACVQISGPIESRYWWNNRIETAQEWLVTMKTRRDLYKPLEKLLLEQHPYDQPEIVATAIAEVSAGYLKWLTEQLKEGQVKEGPLKDVPVKEAPAKEGKG
jgi:periplasmic divalent cation tolerance protein